METNRIEGKVAAIFAERLNIDVPSPETDLFEEGLLDSLGFVELLMHLEQEFGVTVTPEQLDLDNFRTLARIADFTASGLRAASGERLGPLHVAAEVA